MCVNLSISSSALPGRQLFGAIIFPFANKPAIQESANQEEGVRKTSIHHAAGASEHFAENTVLEVLILIGQGFEDGCRHPLFVSPENKN